MGDNPASVLRQIAGTARWVKACAPDQRSRNILLQTRTDLLTRPLIIQKVKRLILDDGTADRAAELAVKRTRDELACHRVRRGLSEGVPGLECITPAVHEDIAMQRVRARPCLRGHEAGNRATELCGKIFRVDSRLTDRIKGRIHDDDAIDGFPI